MSCTVVVVQRQTDDYKNVQSSAVSYLRRERPVIKRSFAKILCIHRGKPGTVHFSPSEDGLLRRQLTQVPAVLRSRRTHAQPRRRREMEGLDATSRVPGPTTSLPNDVHCISPSLPRPTVHREVWSPAPNHPQVLQLQQVTQRPTGKAYGWVNVSVITQLGKQSFSAMVPPIYLYRATQAQK